MANEKSLSQTSIGNSNPSFEKLKDGDGKAPWDSNFGFISPFQDAVLKDLPKSGQPTGSILPKA